MGVYHRDYMRDDEPAGFGGFGGRTPSGPRAWSVVAWILAINIVVYLVQNLFLHPGGLWVPPGGVSLEGLKEGRIYQLITYQFVHGGLFHLLGNGLLIFFVGRMVLPLLGTRRFLMLFLGAGAFGALVQLGWTLVTGGADLPLIGASAAALSLVCALGTLMPNREVYLMLFFVIPIRAKLKQIAWFVVIFDTVFVFGRLFGLEMVVGEGASIGHLAHLGGEFFGWAFVRFLLPLMQAREGDQRKQERWGVRFGTRRVVDAEVLDGSEGGRGGAGAKRPFVSADVDAILDKINREGMQSLTAEERRILDASANELARRANSR